MFTGVFLKRGVMDVWRQRQQLLRGYRVISVAGLAQIDMLPVFHDMP
jgi:hypothetical protein